MFCKKAKAEKDGLPSQINLLSSGLVVATEVQLGDVPFENTNILFFNMEAVSICTFECPPPFEILYHIGIHKEEPGAECAGSPIKLKDTLDDCVLQHNKWPDYIRCGAYMYC